MDYGGGEPSRLFRDLLDLEKDFRYNLGLLTIREDEIERCSQTNRALQENLKSSLAEIERLNAEISNLEAALQAAERRRLRQDQIYQSKMSKLTEDMTSLERENRERLEDYRRKTEEKERERENEWLRKMEDVKVGLRRKVETVEGKVMQEEVYNTKLKTDLQQLLNENMNLRNRLRESQSKNALYTDELKSTRSAAANLNSEIARLKDELASVQTQHDRIQLQNENFRRNDEIRSRKIDELIEERRQLGVEMEKLRRREKTEEVAVGEVESDSAWCSVPEHDKCEEILKQNAVLQEVVKALRRERGGEVEDVRMAEQRLDRLDMLLCQLKNVF